jgi:transposase
MNKPDARLLNPTTQNYLRQQAIRLREQGKRMVDIAAYLGVHRNTITSWWNDYQTYGEAGLQQQQRGAKYGAGRTLTSEQESQVQQQMLDYFPEEVGIDSALWTRRAVQTLIEQTFGVVMPIRTVGEYLKRWGYTPQKPLKRAYEQDPKAVEQWLDVTYPALVEQAALSGAEIAWGDESGLRSDTQSGRGYAPKSQVYDRILNQDEAMRQKAKHPRQT